ncbi:neuronal cell adhesion molecule-like [Mytilus galloprovincialis]|uniref:neuronal cell adhesion molecule-like n=1 Tax=Mytilus galloprovincialis TaxID=29158 RepID=UPI003F7CB1BA
MRSNILVRPTVILIRSKTVDEGTLVEIPCFAEGVPNPFVTWDTVDGKLHADTKQIGHYLVIENVTKADAGYYMCTAINRAGTDIKAVQIQVIRTPARQHTLPVILAPAMVNVDYYTDAKLVCNITGFPTPDVKWLYNQIPQASNGDTLIVPRVTNATTGLYSCIATNDAGTSQAIIMLKATYDPPKIVSPPLPSISVAGESHNFTCRATGHPIPVISWNFDSFSRLPSGLPRHVTFDNGIVLKLVNMQESGVLRCTAENEFGSDTKSAHVIVKHSTAVIG